MKLQTSAATAAALAVTGAAAQGNNPDLGLTSQTSNYTCTSTTVQTLLDGATDNTTHAVVDFAYLIDSNTSLATFKQTVGVNSMQETTPDYKVCAVKVNVTTDEGANFNFGALLPGTWGGRIMYVFCFRIVDDYNQTTNMIPGVLHHRATASTGLPCPLVCRMAMPPSPAMVATMSVTTIRRG